MFTLQHWVFLIAEYFNRAVVLKLCHLDDECYIEAMSAELSLVC
jgi:hypothetical protein